MGADSGQPEPSSWPPGEGRSGGRTWYPGIGWYPDEEGRPPQHAEPRSPRAPYPPGHFPPVKGYRPNSRPVNGYPPNGRPAVHPVNGHPANGEESNSHRVNGPSVHGAGVRGHQLNDAPPPRPDDHLEHWFRDQPERRRQVGQNQPHGREYSSREQEYRQAGDLYAVPGGHSILGLNPPPRLRPGRRGQIRNGMLVGLGCVIVIVAVGTGLTGAELPSRGKAVTGTGGAASAAARPKAKVAGGSPAGRTLTYRVTGTPGTTVTYGPPGRTHTGQGPMHATTTLGSALYYSVIARLRGRGWVACEILIGSRTLSKSVATGFHNLASCQISRDPSSGKWQATPG